MSSTLEGARASACGRSLFFFSSRRRHTRSKRDWSSDVCSSDLKHLGVPESRVQVIFNGVDPEKFSPQRQENGRRARVSSLGHIYPLKGQRDLIDAAVMLRPKFDNLEVCFYGTPSDREYFESCLAKVAQSKLDDCVSFAGPTTEPWRAYNEAEVMAFPSISEAFPYAVLEAMSCGAAIVATDVGGVRDRKSTRLNSSHVSISYAVFCLIKKIIDYDVIEI